MRRAAVPPLLAIPLLGGCATGLFQHHGPTIDELEDGQVHFEKLRSTDDADVYKVCYAVQVRPDVAWNAPVDAEAWFESTDLITDIVPVPAPETETPQVGIRRESFTIHFRGSEIPSLIVLERNEYKRLIEIRPPVQADQSGRVSSCVIKMRPFLEDSTLVVVDLYVSGNLLDAVGGIANLALAPLRGSSIDSWLKKFAEQLAEEHRVQSSSYAEVVSKQVPRTHVIAIGVNALDDPRAASELRLKPLRFAETDAEEFFDWTRRRLAPDGKALRTLLTGGAADPTRRATSTNVQRVLNELGDRVGSGDTVLFYFSGHIATGRNDTIPGSPNYHVAHLLTCDAERSRLASTAITRDDVFLALRSSGARCVFFCDACLSGGFRVPLDDLRPDAGPGPELPDWGRVGPSTLILAADQRHRWAAESERRGNGVFSYWTLEGLDGGADANLDGGVSANELAAYVREKVSLETRDLQRPFFYAPDGYPLDEPIAPAVDEAGGS